MTSHITDKEMKSMDEEKRNDKRKERLRIAVESILLHAVGTVLVLWKGRLNLHTVLLAVFAILCLLYSVKNFSDLKNGKKEKNNPLLVVIFVLIMTPLVMTLFFRLPFYLSFVPHTAEDRRP